MSDRVVAALVDGRLAGCDDAADLVATAPSRAPLHDEDRQLALWALYELHYAAFDEVDERLEWAPELIAVRRALEAETEAWLRERTAAEVVRFLQSEEPVADRIFTTVALDSGPSVARYVRNRATRAQALELMIHRSIYTLKEADPHTWAVPRLRGPAKVALVELQYDEYGAGEPARQHAAMFARALRGCGLDDRYGAYLDEVPATTLAQSNVVSMLGLNRRLRAAAMGHLAAFEATSSLPARDISAGLTRLRLAAATPYFDEHVEADAVHEQLAAREICEVLAAEPGMVQEIAFGAASCLLADRVAGERILRSWQEGRSSLLERAARIDADQLVPTP